jgi:hypothetical protein
MAESPDVWYVRLPDGHVWRAASTAAVRRHLESGQIPFASRVRRSSEDAWALLGRTREFADLIPRRARAGPPRRQAASPAPANQPPRRVSRGRPRHAQPTSVRGFVDELLAALERALVRRRLLGGAAVGLLSAVVWLLTRRFRFGEDVWGPLPWLVAGFVVLALVVLYAVVVTRMLFIELSQLRPATPREIAARLGRNWLWLLLADLLVAGLFVLLFGGLARLGGQLRNEGAGEVLLGVVASLQLVLEVVALPVVGLAFLLAPVVVFEEHSAPRALGQWWELLRQDLSRVFVYEALAVALGVVTSLPLVGPVALAAWSCSAAELLNPVVEGTLALLFGLALTPLITYLAVANVYIFLNLRYERG